MKTDSKRRTWLWRLIGYWSVVRARQRVVLGLVFFAILSAVIITVLTRPVFSSRVTIDIEGVCAEGCNLIHIHSLKPQHYKPKHDA
jgi:hypothetical protein